MKPHPITALMLVLSAVIGCQSKSPVMFGEHNVLVVAPEPLWAQVGDSLVSGLMARPLGLRAEPVFSLTHRAPGRVHEDELRRFRLVVIIGQAGDSIVKRAAPPGWAPESVPALEERSDVWAEGQAVVVLALSEDGGPGSVLRHVPELAVILDREYRTWARQRMYASGVDPELTDSLASAGVELAVPALYGWRRVSDSTFVFATQMNRLDPRLRSVLITWRTSGGREASVSDVLDWRRTMADRHYAWGHRTREEPVELTSMDSPGGGGFEVRGLWTGTVEGQPHGGPFITRVVDCPGQDRTYLLDAWVFAPERGKYPYLLQLETLLDSFGCLSG